MGLWAEIPFRKISYSVLAALCLIIGIFLVKEHIKIIPGKTGIIPLTENPIVAEKVAPATIERGIDISLKEFPLPALERIEPKPLIKQPTVMSKGPVHVPPIGKKVFTKNFQAEALKKTGTAPNAVRKAAASMEIRKIEGTSMNSPSIVPEGYVIQVNAMRDLNLAKEYVEKQKRSGQQVHLAKMKIKDRGVWYIVYIRSFADQSQAARYMEEKKVKEIFPKCFIQKLS